MRPRVDRLERAIPHENVRAAVRALVAAVGGVVRMAKCAAPSFPPVKKFFCQQEHAENCEKVGLPRGTFPALAARVMKSRVSPGSSSHAPNRPAIAVKSRTIAGKCSAIAPNHFANAPNWRVGAAISSVKTFFAVKIHDNQSITDSGRVPPTGAPPPKRWLGRELAPPMG